MSEWRALPTGPRYKTPYQSRLIRFVPFDDRDGGWSVDQRAAERRRTNLSRHVWLVLVIVLSIFAFIFVVHPTTQNASAQTTPVIINVGVQDEMKTRNLIRGFFFGTDVWTADALNPVGEGTVQTDPETQTVVPYTMVGTDVNGDGKFEANELGAFSNVTGIPLRASEWIAFYNINGMKWHDGTQVQLEDVLFGYHLASLAPAVTSSRFVKDKAGQAGSNYSSTRYQNINPVAIAGASTDGWLGGPVADTTHQFALKFIQTGPNAQFKRDTLQATFMPAYFWQGTGVRKVNGVIQPGAVHPDFGWAMNPEPGAAAPNVYLNGVPFAGYTTTSAVTFEGINIASGTHLNAFDVTAASVGCAAGNPSCASPWEAQDQDVIGAGSYKFVHWEAGNFVKLDKNPDYFIPNRTVAAKTLDFGLRVPKVDSIIYRLYRNVQATVFALQAGSLDFIDWTVPPDQVAPITGDPNIGLKSSADAGFFYQSFNFERLPFGYINPAQGSNAPNNDVGRPFRLATAYATDKRTIVTSLLQNFGVAGHTVVSPTNTLYYNASAPRYDFNLGVAASVLDAAAADPFYGAQGYGLDPAGACLPDGNGCRSLPGIGTRQIDMLTPQADYDPIRASAGTLIAQNMRQIGVNLNSKATAFGAIVDALNARNFDMWILDRKSTRLNSSHLGISYAVFCLQNNI